MKIAVGTIIQETCSFNGMTTTLPDFRAGYFKQGAAVVDVPPDEWVIGGFLAAMKGRKFQYEGIIAANAFAGGVVSAEAYAELKDLLLSGIRKAGPFDAVFLALHGAMAAENEPDPEGVFLEEVRALVGPDCFIGGTLDHHANVTIKTVKSADLLVGYDVQPHNHPASGAKAARIMLDMWDNKRKAHAALVKIPMIAPQDHFLTNGGPMKEWFDLARKIEKDPAVLAASNFPMQPWLDVPETGWSSLVYADTAEKAQGYARELGQKAWDLRKQFWRSERLSVADTVAAANAEPKGVVVISDTGDSVYGGASGDSMAFIGEMLKQGLSGFALVPLVDDQALERLVAAGTGRKITLRLGGRLSAGFSPGMEITGVVGPIAPAGDRAFEDGRVAKAGRSVLLDCGNLKIAVLEHRDYAINHPILYRKLGLEVEKAKMVVLKTGSNFQYYRPYQSRLIRADSPGATQSDLTAFTWKNASRPLYPLDNLTDWRAP